MIDFDNQHLKKNIKKVDIVVYSLKKYLLVREKKLKINKKKESIKFHKVRDYKLTKLSLMNHNNLLIC